jgi:hypothetical protein
MGSKMKMVPVGSSLCVAIGYCPVMQQMRIVMLHGGVYDYFGVSKHQYTAFRHSKSKGVHYNKYIKGVTFSEKQVA